MLLEKNWLLCRATPASCSRWLLQINICSQGTWRTQSYRTKATFLYHEPNVTKIYRYVFMNINFARIDFFSGRHWNINIFILPEWKLSWFLHISTTHKETTPFPRITVNVRGQDPSGNHAADSLSGPEKASRLCILGICVVLSFGLCRSSHRSNFDHWVLFQWSLAH